MQQRTTLHISEPCHENWNGMTTTQQGKFCSACRKQVIDFSLMTDQQILTFLSRHSSTLCGRFQDNQLNRTLIETKVSRKKSLWLACTLPFVLLFQKSFGQKQIAYKGDTTIQTNSTQMITGATIRRKIICKPVRTTSTIRGIITDDKNSPIPYATISIKGTNRSTSSDSTGQFSIEAMKADTVTLLASYIGYETIEKQINKVNYEQPVFIEIKTQPMMLGEVVVTGYVIKRISGRLGGVSICRKITTTEKIDSAFKKIVKRSSVTIYPNPAIKGSSIHITVKQSGTYELQLLDNHSNVIRTQQANELSHDATVSFLIPGNISSGVYYLRFIDVNNKKSSLEKLVVE